MERLLWLLPSEGCQFNEEMPLKFICLCDKGGPDSEREAMVREQATRQKRIRGHTNLEVQLGVAFREPCADMG